MKTIILAGGKGTRLPVSAGDKPKVLVEVGGKTILDHQIEWLKKHNLNDITLSLGYRSEQIVKHIKNSPHLKGVNIDYIVEAAPLGTGGALKYASKGIKNDFLALNGDILAENNLTEFIKNYENVPRGTFFGSILAWKCQNVGDFGLLEIENGKIRAFHEKQTEIKRGFINAGVYILNPAVFDGFKAGEQFSIEKDVFPKLAAAGKLKTHIHNGFWTDLGTEERLEEFKKKISSL